MFRTQQTSRAAASRRSVLFFCSLLFVLMLACGPLGGGDNPDDGEPTAQAGTDGVATVPVEDAAPPPTIAPAESDAPEPETDEPDDDGGMLTALSLGAPDDVASYRIAMVLDSTTTAADGTVTATLFTLNGARDLEADATTYTISTSGAPMGGDQTLTMARIGGATYLALPNEGCIAYDIATDDTFSVFVEEDGLLFTDFDNLQRVLPNETINNVEARHFVFDENSVAGAANPMFNLSEVSGDVYLAVDSDRVIRVNMTGRGTNFALIPDSAEGEINYQLDFSDFNNVGEIELPAGCTPPSESDLPLLDDAADLFSGGGITSYSSSYSVEEAVAFYEEALANEGWSGGTDLLTGTEMALLSFTRDGETLNITIAQDNDSGGIAVVLAVSS